MNIYMSMKNMVYDYETIYFMTHGFETITRDWNNDNDIYTMTVCYLSDGYSTKDVEKDRLEDEYKQVEQIRFHDKISECEIIMNDYEITEVKKNEYFEGKYKYGFIYQIENIDGLIFQTDSIYEVVEIKDLKERKHKRYENDRDYWDCDTCFVEWEYIEVEDVKKKLEEEFDRLNVLEEDKKIYINNIIYGYQTGLNENWWDKKELEEVKGTLNYLESLI